MHTPSMPDVPMAPILSHTLWVLHPERPQGPQWRLCDITIFARKDRTLRIEATPHPEPGGDDALTLGESYGFRACLDSLLWQTFAPIFGDENKKTLLFATISCGASNGTPNKAAHVNYTLGSYYADKIEAATSHVRLGLHTRIQNIAAQQQQHKNTHASPADPTPTSPQAAP